jgi:ferredoxin
MIGMLGALPGKERSAHPRIGSRAMRSLPSTRRSLSVRILVDLVRCQSYGQCIYAAPAVLHFNGEQSLEFDYAPDDALRDQVERAVAACPVQAIRIGLPDAPSAEERPVDGRGKA